MRDYAEQMQAGAVFPPVTVLYDGDTYWLADGFHRCHAARQAGLDSIAAEIRQGTRRDAVLHSVGANATHGLQRTNSDKRRCCLTLLSDPEWARWSNREIARQCFVSYQFVNDLRAELSDNGCQIEAPGERLVSRNGTVFSMCTTNIGASASRTERENGEGDPLPVLSHEGHVMEVMSSSVSAEWYTPQELVDRVVDVLGAIDLDPCSNSHSEPAVPALTLYTAADDGLSPWQGRVYLNPPFGDGISRWIERLVTEYEAGNVSEALALVPGRIDTAWFQRLYDFPLCHIRGRIRFRDAANSAPFPSIVAYLGNREECFIEVFRHLGPIVRRIA